MKEIVDFLYSNGLLDKSPFLTGERMYRITTSNGRYYKRNEQLAVSATTFLTLSSRESKYLTSWRESVIEQFSSKEKAHQYVEMTAKYGTLLHILFADAYKRNVKSYEDVYQITFDALKQDIGIEDADIAASEMVKDLGSLIAFAREKNIEVTAIELPVMFNSVATQIDIVCTMDFNGKRQKAIINIKSGKNGAVEQHGHQLAIERYLYNNTFGKDFGQIDLVFNLAPCDWKDKPTYKLTNQTTAANEYMELFPLKQELLKRDGKLEPSKRNYTTLTGEISFEKEPNLKTFNIFNDEIN